MAGLCSHNEVAGTRLRFAVPQSDQERQLAQVAR